MTAHAFVNVVVPFQAKWGKVVDRKLARLADPLAGNRPCPRIRERLDGMRGLHYLSITVAQPACPFEIYERADERWEGDAHLLIEMSSDLAPEETIAELVGAIGETLRVLLRVAGIRKKPEELLPYLLENRLEISASPVPFRGKSLGQVHDGSPGQSAERIRLERELAEHVAREIDDLVQSSAEWHQKSARQRVESIRDWLWSDEHTNWKWAFVPEPAPCLGASPPDEISAMNPQARKAAWRIFHGLAWPLYLPYAVVLAAWFGFVEWAHGPLTALIWSLHAVGYTIVAALVGVGGLYLYLRKLEQRDAVDDRTPRVKQAGDLFAVENFTGQNHLASISRLKPGLFRRLTLRLAFNVVGTGPLVSTPGFLGKNGVIHFARWMRLPNKKQLAFWSNFDDTWESYVADFIADAPSGVTAIWSNCVGFPRSRSLFGGGAADRDRLVRWARRQQHPTRFWYQAYPGLTTARIRTNAAIRQGIASAESQQDCADWLSLFGSTPRPGRTLELPELPTLVFGGLSAMPCAVAMGIAFGRDTAGAWIQDMEQDVTFGEVRRGAATAAALALSCEALRKLGVPAESLSTFPVAFQQGMTTEARSRLLRDEGANSPENWRWGHRGDAIDAFLVLYARTKADLEVLKLKVVARTAAQGHRIPLVQPLRALPDGAAEGKLPKEPFGFADGVSQPVIVGTPRAARWPNPNDLQQSGEFVLGYPDNTGVIPPSPAIPAGCDPVHSLADAGTDPLRKRPESSSYEGRGWRDLGMNGTFLVVRQLRQDVDAFEAWMKEAIATLASRGGLDWERKAPGGGILGNVFVVSLRGPNSQPARSPAVPETPPAQTDAKAAAEEASLTPVNGRFPYAEARATIAAKLVGRWADGTSLVRWSNAPQPGDMDRVPDNDFVYAEDPSGVACPFGSHMRRANPRDTRFPGSQDEIDATNRHRLLRVGRAYENAGGEQGLLFMCLNADIERQFEFVQRTWLLNPQMHGLQDEMDPLLAPGAHRFTIPTGYGPVGLPDLPQLVTVVGGGYFFLPSRTALRFLARLRDSEPMLDRVPEPVEPDLAAEARPHADGLVRERAPDP